MKLFKNPRLFFWALAIAALVIALLPALARARAGGGEDFDGGGGDFGGGDDDGGGGGGGGAGLYMIIWLLFRYPEVGVPVLLIFGVGYYMTHRSVAGYVRGQRTERGLGVMDENREAAAVAALMQRDPAFNTDKFYARVRTAFTKIQDAWCNQNLQSVQAFISDGVHERFSLQFMEQKQQGVRDTMSGLNIENVRLMQLTSDNVFDAVAVQITASSVDQHVSTADGKVLSGSSTPEEYVEYWTFLRRRGVQSTDKDGLIEGNCPNCGAGIAINESAQCPNCKALLRSGQYDWVLAEITQGSEWRPEYETALPGVPELVGQDAGFTLADLEDRTSVMFWRKIRADHLGKIDPLRKIASNDFCSAYQKQLTSPPGQARMYWGDCAVGGVKTLGILPGEPLTRAVVEIRWSGRRYQIAPNGSAKPMEQAHLSQHLMVLGRKAGIKTDPAANISAAHCPNCGAPMADDASDACSFCGTVLNDGSRGWVLIDMQPESGDAAQQLLVQLNSTVRAAPSMNEVAAAGAKNLGFTPGLPDPASLLAWMVKEVAEDGPIDDTERRMLHNVAAKRGISDQQIQVLLDAASHGQLHAPEPSTPAQVEQWMGAMVSAALIDNGELSKPEKRLIYAVGFNHGLSLYDADLLVKREKQLLYNTAVGALRQKRQMADAAASTPPGN
jgi:Tim44-like domain